MEITEYLSNRICDKGICQKDKLQSETHVMYKSNYTEAVHEICHWIASEPQSRHLYNLGLPEDDVDKSHPLYERLYREEAVALVLTKMMMDKYFKNSNGEYLKCLNNNRNAIDNLENKYVNYLYDQGVELGKEFKIDVIGRSEKLFKEYTDNIEL